MKQGARPSIRASRWGRSPSLSSTTLVFVLRATAALVGEYKPPVIASPPQSVPNSYCYYYYSSAPHRPSLPPRPSSHAPPSLSYLIIFSGPAQWRGLTQNTDSESRHMHTTNIRNIFNLFIFKRPFFMLKAPEARLTAVKAGLSHPTLHPQSDLTNMATQDAKKQNL